MSPAAGRRGARLLRLLAIGLLGLAPALLDPRALGADAARQEANDLDAFMATVLKHRDDNWRKLHDYILSEKEAFALDGPGAVRLYGTEREFSWYTRDGYLIRSPLRYDKVTLSESDRRKYETTWLSKEKEREEKHAKRLAEKAERAQRAEAAGEPPVVDVESFMREGGEPRFISEAYFLEFKFEPGNYYLAGRETLDNREVLRIEYYPTRLFDDDEETAAEREARRAREREREERRARGELSKKRTGGEYEREIDRQMNKVALITLWVDPAKRQIVKFTFENVDYGFLPGRWLLRVDGVKASMVMGQPFPDVWLPRQLSFEGSITLAPGTYAAHYTRDYFDYRQGEVRAKIRHYGPAPER